MHSQNGTHSYVGDLLCVIFIEWALFHLMDVPFNPPLNILLDLNFSLIYASYSNI